MAIKMALKTAFFLVGCSITATASGEYIDSDNNPNLKKMSYVQQYSCAGKFNSQRPGQGASLAQAACAPSSVAMVASAYQKPGDQNAYDCGTAIAVANGYLDYSKTSISFFSAKGTNGQSMCDWVSQSSLGLKCSRQASPSELAFRGLLRDGPAIMGIWGFPYAIAGGRQGAADGHYVAVRGFDTNSGCYIVNDPAGNANEPNQWGHNPKTGWMSSSWGQTVCYKWKQLTGNGNYFALSFQRK